MLLLQLLRLLLMLLLDLLLLRSIGLLLHQFCVFLFLLLLDLLALLLLSRAQLLLLLLVFLLQLWITSWWRSLLYRRQFVGMRRSRIAISVCLRRWIVWCRRPVLRTVLWLRWSFSWHVCFRRCWPICLCRRSPIRWRGGRPIGLRNRRAIGRTISSRRRVGRAVGCGCIGRGNRGLSRSRCNLH